MNICSATLIPNGISIPLIGFGTYKIKGEKLIYDCLEAALKANYRSIDTASVYRNEEDIGKALQTLLPKFNLSRSDIFLTSKLSPRDQGSEKCRAAFELSLKQLQTNYLDLFLIHWPGAQNLKVDDCQNKALREESWIELEKLYKEGKIKAIGVSNFNESHLESLLKIASVVPHVNQVEFHPLYKQDSLLSYCRQKGIVIQAYSSLGTTTKDSALLQHPVVQEVALHEGKTEAQVLLKWTLQQGIGVLPKSTNPAHIEENGRLDFKLSQKGLDLLSSITSEKKLAWDSSTFLAMSLPPMFPDLTPHILDAAWIDIDKPVDLNQELKNQELAYNSQLEMISSKGKDIVPIGSNSGDQMSDDEEDANDDDYDDDDDNDDEEEEEDSEMNDEYPDAIIQ